MINQELVEKLNKLLKELFQFENNDLDFGIYRILNIKKKEISDFIEKKLFKIIQNEITSVEDLKELKKESENNNNTKISDRKDRCEEEVYNNIINFFSRYYDDGDFISKRRYSKNNKYSIPYNGEDVILYWANYDQYYIKTSEMFWNFSFKVRDFKINFFIVNEEVDVEKGNIKEIDKKFFIFSKIEKQVQKEISISFGYRGLTEFETQEIIKIIREKGKSRAKKPIIGKDNVNDYNYQKILQQISLLYPEMVEPLKEKHIKLDMLPSKKSELEWYLNKYTTKHSADYFIHKDLKKFLKQELDFYIINEIVQIDNLNIIEFNENIKVIKIFKKISLILIEFLAQIEEFQKKLWEKKKFVISTEYCITLDNIDEKHYPIILKNKKQINEWKKLYSFDLFSETKSSSGNILNFASNNEIEILRRNSSLTIDTQFFDTDFKYKILSEIENLDSRITGILINSENFQAINLLLKKYKEKIKCCYIDPPYNSKSSEILYKNTFKHSSWLSLIENRIEIAKQFLNEKGIFIIAIDENEQEKLGLLLERLFPSHLKTCISIIHNPGGIQGQNFSYTHEYAFFIYPDLPRVIGLQQRDDNPDVRPLRNVSKGAHLRNDAKNCFYPIITKNQKVIGFGDVCDDSYHPESVNIERENGIIEIYPIDPQNIERKWTFSRQSVESIKNQLSVEFNRSRKIWDIIRRKTEFNFKTVWTDKKYNSNIYGSKILNNIIGDNSLFSFPKSLYNVKDCISTSISDDKNAIVIDYFAGSGTTGHAVLDINQEDDGLRKFILVEMGQYFDTVLKPRILRVIFSNKWKNGKPQDGKSISKQIIKYQTLEQYEDSLNNINFLTPNTIALESKDYNIKYMLDFETRYSSIFLNLDLLDNPFEYKLEIEENNEKKALNIDLIETFNYIAGVYVDKIYKNQNNGINYIIIIGKREEKKVIVIWRNKNDSFDPEQDKEFVEKEIIVDDEYDEIFVNGSSLIKNAISLDGLFKKSMLG